MKKINSKIQIFRLVIIAFFSINLISCPISTSIEEYEFLSSDEILEKMNSFFSDTEFTLQSSNDEYSEDYKYRELELSCSEFSDQNVKVCDFIGYNFFWFFPYPDFCQTYFSSTRMSFIDILENAIFTDYYSIKYQNEIYNYFVNILSSLTNSYEYKLLISSPMYRIDNISKNKISSADDYLKSECFTLDILIKKEIDESLQRTFNAFCYDLKNNNIENSNKTSAIINFYFSENYTPSEISDENLKSGNFFTEGDSSITVKSILF